MRLSLICAITAFSLSLQGCTGLGIATGAAATAGVAAAKEGGIRQSARDFKIAALIQDAWFQYDVETFSKVDLSVNQGRVLLTGVVQDPEDRVEAVRLAWSVNGVREVINEIQVADSEGVPGYLRDKWISTRLRGQITIEKDVQSLNYSIDTVQGTVYLMGVAQDQRELDRVIEIARTIPNVRQVVSYVKMAGEPLPAENGGRDETTSSGTDLSPKPVESFPLNE